MVSAIPVTSAEAAVRDYKCSICHSVTPGEGAILRNGVWVPCECASPEWIAHQRERGVFSEGAFSVNPRRRFDQRFAVDFLAQTTQPMSWLAKKAGA